MSDTAREDDGLEPADPLQALLTGWEAGDIAEDDVARTDAPIVLFVAPREVKRLKAEVVQAGELGALVVLRRLPVTAQVSTRVRYALQFAGDRSELEALVRTVVEVS